MEQTNNSGRDAIFNRLDELFPAGLDLEFGHGSSSDSGAEAPSTEQIGTAKAISANTSDKDYRRLVAHRNVTSFSKTETLHNCPRLFELEMYRSAKSVQEGISEEGQDNMDFAFGHAVGSGIQTYGATKSLVAAQFAAFLAWKAPWDAEKLDKRDNPTGKSLAWAMHAIEKFVYFYERELSEWEVVLLPNGKPGVEVSFGVDTQNGFYHFGHIDTILQHKESKRLAVWEGKTTGFATVDDAMYGNSYQALGYGVVVDAITKVMNLPAADYEVFYITYSSKEREFIFLPFTKSLTQRAEWLQDLLLTHATIDKYQELKFFPKRGSNCINRYGRRCEWYGTCQMRNASLFPKTELPVLDAAMLPSVKSVDFMFTLDELVAAQKER